MKGSLLVYYNTLTFLQTFRDYKQELLLHKVDPEDNTIGHVAARSGNPKLFKVTSSSYDSEQFVLMII